MLHFLGDPNWHKLIWIQYLYFLSQTPLNEGADDASSPIVHTITSKPMPAQM